MNELTNLSFLVLVDLGEKPVRRRQRIESLAACKQPYPSASIKALAERGWVTIKPSARGTDSYQIEITPEGQTKYRELITTLRSCHPTTK